MSQERGGGRLGYWNGPNDHDLATHTDESRVMSVVNLGVGFQQSTEALQHTLTTFDVQFQVTEATSAVAPPYSGVFRVTVPQAINYLGINSSARGNDVHYFLGEPVFEKYNGVYYPTGNYVSRGNTNTVLHRIPTTRNLLICVALNPPASYSVPYFDGVRFLAGYLPDETSRLIVEQ